MTRLHKGSHRERVAWCSVVQCGVVWCTALRKEVSCSFFTFSAPAKHHLSVVFLLFRREAPRKILGILFGTKRRKMLSTAFLYDFSARSAEKKTLAIFLARRAAKDVRPLFFGAERRKDSLAFSFLAFFTFSYFFRTVLDSYILALFLIILVKIFFYSPDW